MIKLRNHQRADFEMVENNAYTVISPLDMAQVGSRAKRDGHIMLGSSHAGSLQFFDIASTGETTLYDSLYEGGILAPLVVRDGFRMESVLRRLPILRRIVECDPLAIKLRDLLVLSDESGKTMKTHSITSVLFRPNLNLLPNTRS